MRDFITPPNRSLNVLSIIKAHKEMARTSPITKNKRYGLSALSLTWKRDLSKNKMPPPPINIRQIQTLHSS